MVFQAQNSHRNIKEAQFQISIKPGIWMLFRREEETQRHNLIPMAMDEVGFKVLEINLEKKIILFFG